MQSRTTQAPASRSIPRVGYLDATLALRADPYGFISRHARAVGSDIFQTTVLMQRTLCMVGPEAAQAFYDPSVFQREGAAPRRVKQTLLGEGGVQGLDGEEHRRRKAMFMEILGPTGVEDLVGAVERQLEAAAERWAGRRIVFYDGMRDVLTRAVCAWAGVPLDRVPQRVEQLTDLYQHAGDLGPPHWRARRSRSQAEAWLAGIVQDVRDGRLEPPRAPLAHVAASPLPPGVAAVELLNLLRPTVAVAVFATLLAHAMHVHPESRRDGESHRRAFVQEVRRFYPFFPAAVARVRPGAEWNGHKLPEGARTLLDLHGTNHDPRVWDDPHEFLPDRFLGRDAGRFSFVPQGGGDVHTGHRCAGESATEGIMATTYRFLSSLDHDVPAQDLRIHERRLPALPRSGFVMHVH